MPRETLVRHVTFSPSAATEHSFSLKCKTSLNMDFSVPCIGVGRDSPFAFAHTVVDFAACSLGNVLTHR